MGRTVVTMLTFTDGRTGAREVSNLSCSYTPEEGASAFRFPGLQTLSAIMSSHVDAS